MMNHYCFRFPVNKEVEGTQSYLAFVLLEDYGPCLQIDGDSPESAEKLYDVTDGFSVAALKVSL